MVPLLALGPLGSQYFEININFEMSTSLETTAEIEQFLADHDHFIIDCDGVLWKAGQVLPHVIETIRLLQERGKQVIYVTNNSTKSRQEILPKFEQFGFPSHISTQDLIPSSFAAAKYIEQEHRTSTCLLICLLGLGSYHPNTRTPRNPKSPRDWSSRSSERTRTGGH